jgi:hypothetical protein
MSVARLGKGSGISQAPLTPPRRGDHVLAARAPEPREALERTVADGLPYLILDGKVVASDRLKEKTISTKGRKPDAGIPGKRTASAGTSRH